MLACPGCWVCVNVILGVVLFDAWFDDGWGVV